MRKLFVTLTVAVAFAGMPSLAVAAGAADRQTVAAVEALLDAMEIREVMAASVAAMEEALPSTIRSQAAGVIQNDPGRTAVQKQEALAKLDKMLPVVTQAFSKVLRDRTLADDMIREMVHLYANNYSTEEIKQLTAFYRTPLGRKMLSLTPRLTAESAMIGQRVMMPRIEKLMQDVMQDVKQP